MTYVFHGLFFDLPWEGIKHLQTQKEELRTTLRAGSFCAFLNDARVFDNRYLKIDIRGRLLTSNNFCRLRLAVNINYCFVHSIHIHVQSCCNLAILTLIVWYQIFEYHMYWLWRESHDDASNIYLQALFPRRNSMVIDVKQSRSQYNLGHNPSLRYWQVMHIVDEANLLTLNVVNSTETNFGNLSWGAGPTYRVGGWEFIIRDMRILHRGKGSLDQLCQEIVVCLICMWYVSEY